MDLPSLNEVISLVCAEEGRRGVVLEPSLVESFALVSLKANNQSKRSREEKKAVDRDSLGCTYCKKSRHTMEKCWKLNGRPPKGGLVRNQGQG